MSQSGVWSDAQGLPWWLSGKELPANAGDAGLIPKSRRPPGEGNGNPLSILAWEIPWTEEPGGLQSMGSQRVRYDSVTEQQQMRGGDEAPWNQVPWFSVRKCQMEELRE